MTGDQQDIFTRIKSLLPRWYGDITPLLDGLIQGLAWAGSFIYSLYAYAKLQTRIKTATEGWLDMIAADFFGSTLVRSINQSDTAFRARIIVNLFRERATRAGIVSVLKDLTGRAPIIFEPLRPADTGAYSAPNSGYGAAGGYGSVLLPFQAFVTALRPIGSGIPLVAGYGLANYGATNGGPGGYGTASIIEYGSLDMVKDSISDADIYAAVDSVKPAATIVWTRITS